MLVLTLHADTQAEMVIQGRRVAIVTIERIAGNRVRVGFEAPAAVVINRTERPRQPPQPAKQTGGRP